MLKSLTMQNVILFLGLPVVGFILLATYRATETTHNSLAAWRAADMVISRLASNNNEWPENWAALEDDYRKIPEQGPHRTFDDIANRVTIDFDVDTSKLDGTGKESKPNFRVIYCSDGSNIHPNIPDPNLLIQAYLDRNPDPEP